MGFPGYFFDRLGFYSNGPRTTNIPVSGRGGGRGAGSLVRLLRLTHHRPDPLRYQNAVWHRLPEPRNGYSMPDFDIDFLHGDRREEGDSICAAAKYGRDKVGQIITFWWLVQAGGARHRRGCRFALWAGGSSDQDGSPVRRREARQHRKRLWRIPRACAKEAKNEEVVARLLNYGQQVEGLFLRQRIDPTRREVCDRGPAAGRAGALLSGIALDMPQRQFQH